MLAPLIEFPPGPCARRTTFWRAASVLVAILALSAPAAAEDRVVTYPIVNAISIPVSLTGKRGDAESGRKLYFDRERTGCSGCHGSPDGPGAVRRSGEEDTPKLQGITRRMAEGTIRLWIVAPDVISPGTAMPAYFAVGQRTDPKDPRFGEPRLSAREIEDLVAYLVTAGR